MFLFILFSFLDEYSDIRVFRSRTFCPRVSHWCVFVFLFLYVSISLLREMILIYPLRYILCSISNVNVIHNSISENNQRKTEEYIFHETSHIVIYCSKEIGELLPSDILLLAAYSIPEAIRSIVSKRKALLPADKAPIYRILFFSRKWYFDRTVLFCSMKLRALKKLLRNKHANSPLSRPETFFHT